ncbi:MULTISPECIES: hypothetical protein [unclassified Rhizobium]|uniref:DUF5983 family protein n=1 Tax=unclassified Rhizobium TaxID=2613769 RepID=UPI001AE267F1|nr:MULTISPECIES: hypothetical protein [unclassified Rhizobium]MBP2461419.1 hypothetical protein [Rhizobium sp. PvP014]MBP2528815.1 hypothetical protein [Rhizobium sp. PvP099]
MSYATPDARDQNALRSLLLISTGHLTWRTAKFLRDHDAADWPSPGGHYGDLGWFFWVNDGANAIVPHLPHDLMSAFEYAAIQGASFLIFQDVSRVVPQLPTYIKSGAFEANAFLNRRKAPIESLDEYAAAESQKFLSLDPDFIATPAYVAVKMAEVIDDIATHATNSQLSALRHDSLQQLSDLAITYHFHTKRNTKGFGAKAKLIEDLAAEMDAILANHDLASLGKHRRAREILDNVQYRLRLTNKLFDTESTGR